jgi:hypothetical protein
MKFRLLISLSIVVLLCSCERPGEQFSKEMLQQISKLPQDSHVFGYANIQKMQQSSLMALLSDSGKIDPFHDPDYKEFVKATGFNLQKDVKELYFAANFDEKNCDGAGLVIAMGHFQPKKMMSYVTSRDSCSHIMHEKLDDYDFYFFNEKSFCACFPDSGTLVGGKTEMVKQWLGQATPDQGKQIDAHLMQRLQKIRYKNTCWIYSDFSISRDFIKNSPDEIKNITEGILNLTISTQIDEKLSIYGECECHDDEKADLLKDAIKGGIAAFKLSQSNERDVIDTLNKIHIQKENNYIRGDFSLTKEDVQRIINIHKNERKITL